MRKKLTKSIVYTVQELAAKMLADQVTTKCYRRLSPYIEDYENHCVVELNLFTIFISVSPGTLLIHVFISM